MIQPTLSVKRSTKRLEKRVGNGPWISDENDAGSSKSLDVELLAIRVGSSTSTTTAAEHVA
jgi:hypothetical protein